MGKAIVIDASGSMAEEGKKSVIRYLLHAVEGLARDEYPEAEYKIYAWNETISEFETKIDFSGHTSADAFSDFLNAHPEDSILLVGDGNYSEEIKAIIERAGNAMLVLMVGSDCNRARLRKLVGTGHLYETTDVVACFHDFIQIA